MAVTNKELYEGINSVRVEIQKDIAGLRTEINKIETGRLTQLDKEIAVIKTKILMFGSIIGFVTGIVGSIIIKIATRTP